MDIFVIKTTQSSIRGYVSRYLQPISKGIYAGNLSFKVASLLWQKIIVHGEVVEAIWLRSANNEAGLIIKTKPETDKIDLDGLDFLLT